MNVLVDTCIWSLAFRRKKPENYPEVERLAQLIRNCRAEVIGPIRQEVLSGIRETSQFEKVRSLIENFPDVLIQREDWETAARFHNICRSRGVQGSHTDFLICAVAVNSSMEIFTMDKDFEIFRLHLPIHLLQF